jgi:hypothetical protein
MQNNHPLFKKFPLNGSAMTSEGTVPTPYHIYDGNGVFIGGTANLSAVRELLRNEFVLPVETTDGDTLMGIWICNFTDASLGPHHELQFSFFTTSGQPALVRVHRLGLISLMMRPEVRMLCHGLWNNTPRAVAYNREVLSLDARLTTSEIDYGKKAFSFNFHDSITGQPVLSGDLAKAASLRASWDLVCHLGLRRTLEFSRQPWVGLPILNPTGVFLPTNEVAESYTKNDKNLVRYFDEGKDRLEFGDNAYARLSFEPQFVQYMEGFKFVYLHPGVKGSEVNDQSLLSIKGGSK